MKPELPDNRVIVPLSGPVTGDSCYELINQLGPYVWGFKLHPTTIIRLFREDHTDVLQLCEDAKARIFIDLEGFDIPTEIANMISDIEASAKIDITTVHQSGGTDMVKAAVEAAKRTMIFPVTILTTMTPAATVKSYAHPDTVVHGWNQADWRDAKIKQFAEASIPGWCTRHYQLCRGSGPLLTIENLR